LRKGSLLQKIKKGQSILIKNEKVKIDVLHPSELAGSTNENSIVTYLTYKDTSILLTGDIGIEQFDDLIQENQYIISADVIQIPHHGKTISSRMLTRIHDKIFIVSSGKSEWGGPPEELLGKLKGEVYRTDKHGNVVIESNGENIKVSFGRK